MNSFDFNTFGFLFICLLPVSFLIIIAKKILHKEEINFLDYLLTIYTNIWIIILTIIGFYLVKYYMYLKGLLGMKEEYLWILIILAIFLALYNIYLWLKISKAKERRLDKW